MSLFILSADTPQNKECGIGKDYIVVELDIEKLKRLMGLKDECMNFLKAHRAEQWGAVKLIWSERFRVFGYDESLEQLMLDKDVCVVESLPGGDEEESELLRAEVTDLWELHSVYISHDRVRFRAIARHSSDEIESTFIPFDDLRIYIKSP